MQNFVFPVEEVRVGGTQHSATIRILAKSIYDNGATSSNPACGFRD